MTNLDNEFTAGPSYKPRYLNLSPLKPHSPVSLNILIPIIRPAKSRRPQITGAQRQHLLTFQRTIDADFEKRDGLLGVSATVWLPAPASTLVTQPLLR